MNKKEFFKQLHTTLAEKYSIDLYTVGILRDFILGRKKTKDDAIEWLEERIKNSYLLKDKTKNAIYENTIREQINKKNTIIDEIENLTELQLQDIIQKTEFDKG